MLKICGSLRGRGLAYGTHLHAHVAHAAHHSSWGRESTRRLMVTTCRSLVPVADEMLRGRMRTSKRCGVCSQGMRKCVPSP